MGCPIRGVILDPIVAMQMGIQGQVLLILQIWLCILPQDLISHGMLKSNRPGVTISKNISRGSPCPFSFLDEIVSGWVSTGMHCCIFFSILLYWLVAMNMGTQGWSLNSDMLLIDDLNWTFFVEKFAINFPHAINEKSPHTKNFNNFFIFSFLLEVKWMKGFISLQELSH